MEKQEARLKKSHVFLLKHPKVHQLGGIILMGTNEVVKGIPTAYTDGVNKRYGEEFLAKLKDEEINGLVLHENCHIFYRHVTHHKTTFKENAKLANIAADFVVNDMIVEMKDAKIALPEGGLYNPMFHNWSMSKVYAYLKQRKKELDEEGQGQGQGQGGQPQDNNSPGGETLNDRHGVTDIDKLLKNLNDHDSLDEHDYKAAEKYDEKEISEKVDRALREGGLLAGILGGDKNRQIEQLLEPKVDWREALREFVMAQCAGRSDYTWRRFNNRQVANDIYMPSVINESIGEIVVAIDTSGSIGAKQLTEFATELVSICDSVMPEKVRVLWWDTKVHGEQVFQDNYASLAHMLKPVGGGGTKVSCVSEYLVKKRTNTECVVVFTDGYLENDIKWTHQAPTLWMVTENKNFTPPVGKKVFIEGDQ